MSSEKRLIDANVFNHAYEFVKKHMVAGDSEFLQGYEAGILGAYNAINKIDTVDAVEVVRCKDCIHRTSSEFCECRPVDFFCAEGERKDNERKAD